MANRTKRADRSTGNYNTVDELEVAVMKLYKSKKHSQAGIATMCGISGPTCSRIVRKNNPAEPKVDLNAMFDELWKITEAPEEEEYV